MCATVNRCPRHARLTLLFVGFGLVACEPAPPAGPEFVRAWGHLAGSVAATTPGDELRRARVSALVSLAMFEGYAADGSTGLRSLAGQVNGLWSVAGARERGAVDGAIVAAEAQRLVLDSLAFGDARARAVVDSLARAHLSERRIAGVSADVAERSLRHGAAVGKTVLALASAQVPRTFVLRHADECALAPRNEGYAVTAQGEPAGVAGATAVAALASDLAEAAVVAAMERADALAAARSKVSPPRPQGECVAERVRGRIRTRAPSP